MTFRPRAHHVVLAAAARPDRVRRDLVCLTAGSDGSVALISSPRSRSLPAGRFKPLLRPQARAREQQTVPRLPARHPGRGEREPRGARVPGRSSGREASSESGRPLRVLPLSVVHPPDLVIDVLGGKEGDELPFVVPAVGVKHLADGARIRSVAPETADGARYVPVDRSSKRVLQVVPDQAAGGP